MKLLKWRRINSKDLRGVSHPQVTSRWRSTLIQPRPADCQAFMEIFRASIRRRSVLRSRSVEIWRTRRLCTKAEPHLEKEGSFYGRLPPMLRRLIILGATFGVGIGFYALSLEPEKVKRVVFQLLHISHEKENLSSAKDSHKVEDNENGARYSSSKVAVQGSGRDSDDEFLINTPQEAVLADSQQSGLFLTIHLTGDSDEALRQTASIASSTVLTLSHGERNSKSVSAIGFSERTWRAVQDSVPAGVPLHSFQYASRHGRNGSLPATGGDIFLHVVAESRGDCFHLAKQILENLPAEAIADAEDIYGFEYCHGKDLFGFPMCGSQMGKKEAQNAAIIPSTGGTYALAQLWRHDLPKYFSLSQEDRDKVIGKSSKTNRYIGGDHLAATDAVDLQEQPGKLTVAIEQGLPESSHVARMIGVDQDSCRLRILSHSMPCGNLAPGPSDKNNIHEPGMFFLAYCNNPNVFDYMLNRMTGNPIRGNPKEKRQVDSIMQYSQCIRGQLYYVPSKQQLRALAQL